jgi:hypothetical protein
VEAGKQRLYFSSPWAFKTYAKGRKELGDSHPIISEWGGAWVVPWPGEGGPEPSLSNLHTHSLLSHIFMSPELFPNFSLPQHRHAQTSGITHSHGIYLRAM